MNNTSFLRYIENNRDCDKEYLCDAVKKGINRAKNDRVDSKKILTLVFACIFTFFMCVTIHLKPFKNAAQVYYENWHNSMPNVATALDGYINIYSGGE